MNDLNARAARLVATIADASDLWRVRRVPLESTAHGWDFGNHVPGGLQAGLALAQICLADLADVRLIADPDVVGTGARIQVYTDHPRAACLRSQYAGWKIARGSYFAMGSGPMRAAAAVERLIQQEGREQADQVVGVMESSQLPTDEIVHDVAHACQVSPSRVHLLTARTASQAGTVQIVARSVETALHKLLELEFDLSRLVSGLGTAPLPPVAPNDLAGIGRTNDAILYGAEVTLWVCGKDDDTLQEIVSRVPSNSSADYGQPFAEIFARYDHDFYRIDPQLFSPALVRMVNIETGRVFQAGRIAPEILAASWK
jgi:methenyltetrahydromethanopterin cyclohydrolase